MADLEQRPASLADKFHVTPLWINVEYQVVAYEHELPIRPIGATLWVLWDANEGIINATVKARTMAWGGGENWKQILLRREKVALPKGIPQPSPKEWALHNLHLLKS